VFGGDFLEGLDKHFGGNVVALVDHGEPEPSKDLFGILFHGDGLDHGDDNIFSLDICGIPLKMSDGDAGKECPDPVLPLILQEGIVDDNESLDAELRGNVEGAHGLSSSCLKTDHAVMRLWLEVRIDNFHLGGTHGTGKGPSIAGGGDDIEGGGTPPRNAELFGYVHEILGFPEHRIFLDVARVDKDGGDVRFDREFLPEFFQILYQGFGDFVTVASDGID
jgi:hypothetical protein